MMLRIIIFCSIVALVFCAETRVKVGTKRWAFKIETNQGKNVRKEGTDDSGNAFGTFSFITPEGQARQLKYKFNLNGEEPDIQFDIVDDGDSDEQQNQSQNNEAKNETTPETTEAEPAAALIKESNDTTEEKKLEEKSSSNITVSEADYESIDGGEDFSGHVSLKVGKTVYFINFLSGDKSAAREEAFDENGMIYGKYTYINQDKQSKVVVNYKFNSTGSDPTFEVSLYKKSEPNRANPIENESNTNAYYNPNRVDRRVLVPSYHRQNRIPSVTIQGTNPPHNVITPMQGNWYYRVQ